MKRRHTLEFSKISKKYTGSWDQKKNYLSEKDKFSKEKIDIKKNSSWPVAFNSGGKNTSDKVNIPCIEPSTGRF